MVVCRHCKSPNRWNPCWYGVTVAKGADPGGADPPCIGDMYDDDARERRASEDRANLRWLLIVLGAFGLLVLAAQIGR